MDGVVVSTVTDEGAMVRRDTNILWRYVAVTAWLSSMGCCACELPEAKVAGRAVDAETLEPLADVRIEWNGESKTTGKDGAYTFTMPVGVQELRVSHGDAQFSTLVVVGHSKWKQGLAQVQDVVVRNMVPTSRAFTLNFLGADFNDVEQDFASGLLATNVDGGGAAFLKVANHLSQLPQWDAPAKSPLFRRSRGQRTRVPSRHPRRCDHARRVCGFRTIRGEHVVRCPGWGYRACFYQRPEFGVAPPERRVYVRANRRRIRSPDPRALFLRRARVRLRRHATCECQQPGPRRGRTSGLGHSRNGAVTEANCMVIGLERQPSDDPARRAVVARTQQRFW